MQRPRPVLSATGVAGLVTSLAGVLGWLGYVAPAADLSARADTIGAILVGAIALGSHLFAGFHAQAKVTPNSAPQDHDGTRLARIEPVPLATPAATVSRVIDVEPLESS